jgi:sulfite reductase (NADPH) flavoprotein alpha-component
MDARLEALGGKRVFPRQDCDVDFEDPYLKWATGVIEALQPDDIATDVLSAAPAAAPLPTVEYGRKNPFSAEVTERVLLNGTGSAKEIYHLELSLEWSGMISEPGDSLGVVPTNQPEVVDAILEKAGISGEEAVESHTGTKSIRSALIEDYEITVLTSSIVKKYAGLAKNDTLDALLADREKLKDWLYGRQLADLVFEFPVEGLKATDFLNLARKLPPRLYSIASSLMAYPDAVHLTVGAVRYQRHGLALNGVASTHLADRVDVGGTMPVYIQKNKSFRLPENSDTPIIMVGPGTGIAPFRAFVQERVARGAQGKSWLFFGDQHFNTDFLYQLEWQDYLKSGALSRINTAFSRDQSYKIYVQDRMREHAADLYAWLEDGAHFYVCGDASRMAKDVHQALIEIVAEQGKRSPEEAEAFVKQLQKEKRYQRDVY